MIEIKINRNQTAQGQSPIEGGVTQQQEPGKPTVQNQAINTALISAGKQIINQGVDIYANLTGNYAMSETFGDLLSIGGDILTATLGPVGWVAVGSKHLISIANSYATQKRAVDNIELERVRAGFISTQGSRY